MFVGGGGKKEGVFVAEGEGKIERVGGFPVAALFQHNIYMSQGPPATMKRFIAAFALLARFWVINDNNNKCDSLVL